MVEIQLKIYGKGRDRKIEPFLKVHLEFVWPRFSDSETNELYFSEISGTSEKVRMMNYRNYARGNGTCRILKAVRKKGTNFVKWKICYDL